MSGMADAAGIEKHLAAFDLGADDVERLCAFDALLGASDLPQRLRHALWASAAPAVPFQTFVDAFFDELPRCDFGEEHLRQQAAGWAQCLSADWPVPAFGKYLALATLEAARLMKDDPDACAATIIALQKLVLFHLDRVGALQQTNREPPPAVMPSHAPFLQRLRHEVRQRDGQPLAVLIMSTDSRSRLDGVLGYDAGAALAGQVVESLRLALRDGDVVEHIGSDEFGLILPSVSSEGHVVLAAHKILRTLEKSFMVAGQPVYINPSLGISLYPEHGRDADDIMQRANLAMQSAHETHAGFAFHNPERDQSTSLQFSLETDLRHAIEENQLFMLYQPQLDLATGCISGAEALVRWNHSSRGAISPGQLVAIAEKTGLISPLTMWVFNTALRQCADHERMGADVTISVNVSAHTLREPDFPEFVDQALKTWAVTPARLVVEVTESAMLEEQARCLQNLARLKALGVMLSMDDFGTGYSSMTQLRKLPLDELKIDLSFVRHMLRVKEDEKIVRSVIDLAHNFGLKVVAEGVEDKETLEFLRELACDTVQGFHVGLPVSDVAFKEMLAAQV